MVKQIARGKGKQMGDIDCWRFETKPSLEERKTRLETELNQIEHLYVEFEKFNLNNASYKH